MKFQIIRILLLLFFSTNVYSQATVVKAKAYLNVRTGELIEPAIILIDDGIIKALNPEFIPEDSKEIDLGEKILVPGLMDMHVHLDMDFIKNHATLMVTESSSKRTLRAAKNAEKTLLAGFTTVRNIGQVHPTIELIDVALSEASDEGWIKSPRLIPCGHMIGITGGHADLSMFGGFGEGVMDLSPEYGIADGVDEVLKATRYQIKHGAKAIKIMATSGVTTLEKHLGAQQLTFEEMKTIVDEADRHGITVAAHGHGTEGIIAAIKAGVTSIEHGSFLNDEAINLMKERGTYLVPTIALQKQVNLETLPPIIAKKAKEATAASTVSYKKAIEANINFALGTDAPLVPHGKNALEFQAMIAVGMKPLNAIQAATIHPAKMLDLNDRGEIKEGLLADLIAVDANPINDIKVLESVKFVMKGGVIYKNDK